MAEKKKCEPTILSVEEKKKRRDTNLDKIDAIINNTMIADEEKAVNDILTKSPEELEAQAIINEVVSVKKIQGDIPNPPVAENPIPIIKIEPIIVKPFTTRTEFSLPVELVAEIMRNPLFDENFLADLHDIITKERVMDLCDPETLEERTIEFKELGKGKCSPVIPDPVEREAQRNGLLKQMVTILMKDDAPPQDVITPDNIDEFIKNIKPDGILSIEEANECIEEIRKAVKEIKEHNAFIREELLVMGDLLLPFFANFASLDYQIHVLILYAERYGVSLYINDINDVLSELETRMDNFQLATKFDEDKLFDNIVAKTYRDFIKEQIFFYRNQIGSIESTRKTVHIRNEMEAKGEAREAYGEIPKLLEGDFTYITDGANVYDIEYGIDLESSNGAISDHYDVITRPPEPIEITNNTYLDNLLQDNVDSLQNNIFPLLTGEIRDKNIEAAQLIHPVIFYNAFPLSSVVENPILSVDTINIIEDQGLGIESETANKVRAKMIEVKDRMIPYMERIINIYEIADVKSQKEKAVEILSKIVCAGKPIIEGIIPLNKPCSVTKDLTWNTFPANKDHELTNIEYWRCFQDTLNEMGKNYRATGYILPESPSNTNANTSFPNFPPFLIPFSGINEGNEDTRVDLLIEWIPLTVIPTQASVIVIFLTVNGIIITPTVWIWKFKPIGLGESLHLILFKGGDQMIKRFTAITTSTLGVVDGLDLDPALTKTSPFIEDDLPPPERMSTNNTAFVRYLTAWLQKAIPFMGFP